MRATLHSLNGNYPAVHVVFNETRTIGRITLGKIIQFSVIIATLNECESIRQCIRQVRYLDRTVEIIVVDGGSTDGTIDIAIAEGARVVQSPPGRGTQLHAGRLEATGDILLFLHADTTLPDHAFYLLRREFRNPSIRIGTFHLSYDNDSPLLRFYSWFTRFDSVFTKFGDQCIIVRRAFYDALGGFPQWPLFEDVKFLQDARTADRIHLIPGVVTTSARRFVGHGIIRQQVKNGFYLLLYLIGVSPITLAKRYNRMRNDRLTLPASHDDARKNLLR